jgi:hypothetical protein
MLRCYTLSPSLPQKRRLGDTSFGSLQTLSQHKKTKAVGSPKPLDGKVKGRIVPVRLNHDDLTVMIAAAVVAKQTLTEWIRSTLYAAVQG